MAQTKPITDEEFAAANRAGAARRARGVAVSVRYYPAGRSLAVLLSTGATLIVPVDLVEGLANQADDTLADVMLHPGGRGLTFRRLDADLSVAGLLDGIFGSPRWMAGRRDVRQAGEGWEPIGDRTVEDLLSEASQDAADHAEAAARQAVPTSLERITQAGEALEGFAAALAQHLSIAPTAAMKLAAGMPPHVVTILDEYMQGADRRIREGRDLRLKEWSA